MDTYAKIKELCGKRNINITGLCSECDIPRSTLSDLANGRTKSLSFEKLSKIADYFGVSIDYLTGREGTQSGDEAAKVALFGGDTTVTDEMWNEVKRYAAYIKERENGDK